MPRGGHGGEEEQDVREVWREPRGPDGQRWMEEEVSSIPGAGEAEPDPGDGVLGRFPWKPLPQTPQERSLGLQGYPLGEGREDLDVKDEDELGTYPGESGGSCGSRDREEKGLKGGWWGWIGSRVGDEFGGCRRQTTGTPGEPLKCCWW